MKFYNGNHLVRFILQSNILINLPLFCGFCPELFQDLNLIATAQLFQKYFLPLFTFLFFAVRNFELKLWFVFQLCQCCDISTEFEKFKQITYESKWRTHTHTHT